MPSQSFGTVSSMIGEPVQIAYGVDDVRSAAARWVTRGVGPFFVLDHIELSNVRLGGEPAAFDHSSAYGQWGSLMVELICQHDRQTEPFVYPHGIHHVAYMVDNFAAAHAELIGSGSAEALYAETATGMPFAMHDALLELGHHIEIYEGNERLRGFYEMVRTASATWDGADPIRTL